MSDRIAEIRARLDALETHKPYSLEWQGCLVNAPADIAWLLNEVERLGGGTDGA